MLKPFNQFTIESEIINFLSTQIDEAISPSIAKRFMNFERNSKMEQRQNELWEKLMNRDDLIDSSRKSDRLYFEFNRPYDTDDSPIFLAINKIIEENNAFEDIKYEVSDYIKGILLRADNDQKMKIGKFLTKLNKKYESQSLTPELQRSIREILGQFGYSSIDELKQAFDSDPIRTGASTADTKKYLVFSRHKYDIAGMSSDRNWTSCMDALKLIGSEDTTQQRQAENRIQYIGKDIEFGTFIVYLIKANDMNIQNPEARVLIKPFVNINTLDVVFVAEERVYGDDIKGFRNQVVNILDKHQDYEHGMYKIHTKLYCDSKREFIVNKGGDVWDVVKHMFKYENQPHRNIIEDGNLIRNINKQIFNLPDSAFKVDEIPDLHGAIEEVTVYYKQDVHISGINIERIPFVIESTQNFSVTGVGLKQLMGIMVVNGNLDISNNNVIELDIDTVEGDVNIRNNPNADASILKGVEEINGNVYIRGTNTSKEEINELIQKGDISLNGEVYV
jgi:hypothetical protein